MDEKTMLFLEEHIPELAQAAVTEAYWKALASGHKVLKSENGFLIEISPDGTKKILKKLPPPFIKEKGLKVRINETK
jgi:hypothetical protein